MSTTSAHRTTVQQVRPDALQTAGRARVPGKVPGVPRPSDGIGKSTPGTRGARRRVLTFEAWLGGAGIRTTTEGPSRTAGGQHVLVAVASPAMGPVPSGLGGPDRQEFR